MPHINHHRALVRSPSYIAAQEGARAEGEMSRAMAAARDALHIADACTDGEGRLDKALFLQRYRADMGRDERSALCPEGRTLRGGDEEWVTRVLATASAFQLCGILGAHADELRDVLAHRDELSTRQLQEALGRAVADLDTAEPVTVHFPIFRAAATIAEAVTVRAGEMRGEGVLSFHHGDIYALATKAVVIACGADAIATAMHKGAQACADVAGARAEAGVAGSHAWARADGARAFAGVAGSWSYADAFGAIAFATCDGALSKAMAAGSTAIADTAGAEAWACGENTKSVADAEDTIAIAIGARSQSIANASGGIARAKGEGAEAHARKTGTRAFADGPRTTAYADAADSRADARHEHSAACATKDGALARACVAGSEASAVAPGAQATTEAAETTARAPAPGAVAKAGVAYSTLRLGEGAHGYLVPYATAHADGAASVHYGADALAVERGYRVKGLSRGFCVYQTGAGGDKHYVQSGRERFVKQAHDDKHEIGKGAFGAAYRYDQSGFVHKKSTKPPSAGRVELERKLSRDLAEIYQDVSHSAPWLLRYIAIPAMKAKPGAGQASFQPLVAGKDLSKLVQAGLGQRGREEVLEKMLVVTRHAHDHGLHLTDQKNWRVQAPGWFGSGYQVGRLDVDEDPRMNHGGVIYAGNELPGARVNPFTKQLVADYALLLNCSAKIAKAYGLKPEQAQGQLLSIVGAFVALGVGEKESLSRASYFGVPRDEVERFVRDWRVGKAKVAQVEKIYAAWRAWNPPPLDPSQGAVAAEPAPAARPRTAAPQDVPDGAPVRRPRTAHPSAPAVPPRTPHGMEARRAATPTAPPRKPAVPPAAPPLAELPRPGTGAARPAPGTVTGKPPRPPLKSAAPPATPARPLPQRPQAQPDVVTGKPPLAKRKADAAQAVPPAAQQQAGMAAPAAEPARPLPQRPTTAAKAQPFIIWKESGL